MRVIFPLCVCYKTIDSGDGFGNQSYLMIHLFILANLPVQFRNEKQRIFLFSMYFLYYARVSGRKVPFATSGWFEPKDRKGNGQKYYLTINMTVTDP